MPDKFADKIKKRIAELRKDQEQNGEKKPGRKSELFRENKEENNEKPVKH